MEKKNAWKKLSKLKEEEKWAGEEASEKGLENVK